MNEIAQNSSYGMLTGMNITIDDLPTGNSVILNDDVSTLILDFIQQIIQENLILSPSYLKDFKNGCEDSISDVESLINMHLEDLFDMISCGIGDNWMATGPQPWSTQVLSQNSGVITFPNKEVCGCFRALYIHSTMPILDCENSNLNMCF